MAIDMQTTLLLRMDLGAATYRIDNYCLPQILFSGLALFPEGFSKFSVPRKEFSEVFEYFFHFF